ncbi:Werner Syndrome-like exonuclease [Morus notabilis]|uniref:Werner Syndrome-like exonuclease n=1 Tax=Morus notabilis TaxID=981085 RepID=W9S7B8_9ROSA|nr:Werner Syndrome-like exonuclease [Morus notabilis]EXC30705.1 Werner Syndrome-like exonuclease [Morus notabilis]
MPTQQYSNINLGFDNVTVLITNDPLMVDSWIADIERIHRWRLDRLVVGLDIEWRPYYVFSGYSNPVAVLQLCVGRRCLVFQILYAPYVPYSLYEFFQNNYYTFVGVGIEGDVEKLEAEHGLRVENAADIGHIAAEQYGHDGLKNAGMRRLAMLILNLVIDKPMEVTLSAWDSLNLSFPQIRYAAADAFVSFEMGRVLQAWLYY